MSNQDKIDALVKQLTKVQGEITAEIKQLKDKVDSGSGDLDFTALEKVVQTLDDLNPDQPTEPSKPEQPGTDEPAPEQPSTTEPEQPGTGETA
ncbi:hypothetical protein CRH09_35895 [Nocardia terpenica]|uniref:Uncharacterized protein n=2 Tax=Nocardia terpenica TaxID=455432 RepID=A0A291RU41_9NOCA|nr:hypothetical protein CRH09_35895 [Nocardia terpenica]